MHADLAARLRCPACATGFEERSLRVLRDDHDTRGRRVLDGTLTCPTCDQWYRIEDCVVDLRSAELVDRDAHEAFARRFGLATSMHEPSSSRDEAKAKQHDFFADHADEFDRDVVNSPYYRALERLTLQPWIEALAPAGLALDLGAGTGHATVTLASQGLHVVAFDLNEPVLRIGQKRVQGRSLSSRVDFVLGDAERLPIVDRSVDAVLAYGVLHHLEAPDVTMKEVGRVLRGGGRWFSLDPHDSPMRWAFDLAMRAWELYVEEASSHPLQTERSLVGWCEDAGIAARAKLSTWVLPHLFVRSPVGLAAAAIRVTDALCRRIPVVAGWGGVIFVEGVKR